MIEMFSDCVWIYSACFTIGWTTKAFFDSKISQLVYFFLAIPAAHLLFSLVG